MPQWGPSGRCGCTWCGKTCDGIKEDLSQLRKVVGWNHWNGNRVRQDTTPTHFMQLKSNGNERFPKLRKKDPPKGLIGVLNFLLFVAIKLNKLCPPGNSRK